MGEIKIISVKEAASMLGWKERSLRNKIQKKSKHPFPIKALRQGRKIGFDLREIEAYVNSLKEDATAS